MFKSAACIISGLGLILSSFFSPAYSATIEKGGVIHFVARWSLTRAKSRPGISSSQSPARKITV